MSDGFHCQTCGQYHPELPLFFGAAAPVLYETMSADEQATRCELTPDFCVIDGVNYFIRGLIEIPIIGDDRVFAWGVWCSLSRENFDRSVDLMNNPDREREPPYFGWLSTALPYSPSTINLKTHVHTGRVGYRPTIELEPTDHPLAIEQREGITLERVRQIAESLLHS